MRATPLATAMVVLVILSGCGGDLAYVSGTVTLDGQPVPGGQNYSGTVSFYREEGGGAPAIGRIDASGKYSVRTGGQDGIAPGTYLVGVAVKRILPPPTAGGMPQAELITPRQYASITQSGLREEIEPGNNTINFDLTSR